MAKRYFLTYMQKLQSDNDEFIKPSVNAIVGVADERHFYADSEDLSHDGNVFTVDIYKSLDEALSNAFDKTDLSCFNLSDSLTEDEVKHVSDYINNRPDLLESKSASSSGRSLYTMKAAYKDLNAKMAACEVNGLDVDFSKSKSIGLYDDYRIRLTDDIRARHDSLFHRQAFLEKNHAIRFSDKYVDSICSLNSDTKTIDNTIDKLYEGVMTTYDVDYVSANDMNIENIEAISDTEYTGTVEYGGKTYNIRYDDSDSHARQAADQIFDQILREQNSKKNPSVPDKTEQRETLEEYTLPEFDGDELTWM